MTRKDKFEAWVGELLVKRFSSGSSSITAWKNEVLRRYYKFGEEFDLFGEGLYSKVTFALWFSGGQK